MSTTNVIEVVLNLVQGFPKILELVQQNAPLEDIAQQAVDTIMTSFNHGPVDVRNEVRSIFFGPKKNIAHAIGAMVEKVAAAVLGITIDHEANVNVDANGLSMLDKALIKAIDNDVEILVIQNLIELGAHIDLKSDCGMRLTHFAAKRSRADVLTLLLDRGATLENSIFDMYVTHAVATVLCKHVVKMSEQQKDVPKETPKETPQDAPEVAPIWEKRAQPCDVKVGDYVDVKCDDDEWHSARVKNVFADSERCALYVFDLHATVFPRADDLALAGSRATKLVKTEPGQLVSVMVHLNKFVPAEVTTEDFDFRFLTPCPFTTLMFYPYGYEGVKDDAPEAVKGDIKASSEMMA